MTLFGNDQTEAPELRSFETPKEGVGRPNIFGPLTNLFDAAAGIKQTRKEAQGVKAVSDFTKQQLLVADAYAQGRFKNNAEHARTLMRQNLMAAIDANPALAAEFIKAQNSILGIEGGAKVISTRTDAENRERARADALISANLLPYDYTQDQFVDADQKARRLQLAEEEYQTRKQQIEAEMAEIGLSNARRKQLKEMVQEATTQYVRAVGPAHAKQMTTTFRNIVEGAGSESEKEQAIQDLYLEWMAEAGSAVNDLDESVRNAYLRPFEEIRDTYLARARGEINDAETERQIKRMVAAQEQLMLADPAMARAVALGKHIDLGAWGVLADSAVQQRALAYLNGAINGGGSLPPYTSDPKDAEAVKFNFEQALNGIQSDDPVVRESAMNVLVTILGDFEKFEGILRDDSEKGISVARMLADPKFYEAVSQNPELLENTEGAALAMETHFSSEVWAMAEREFNNNNVRIFRGEVYSEEDGTGFDEYPTNAVIEAVPVSGGVTFRVIAGLQGDVAAKARAEARRLNEKLAPALNTTVKAMAHLEGHNNYKQLWESVADQILAGQGGSQGGGGLNSDPLDDLEVSDFQNQVRQSDVGSSDMVAFRNAIASIESAGSGDYEAIGPRHAKLGRALGRYQIMEANIGPWSREVLGREITVEEFMANPDLQDAIFDGKFGQYVREFGPEGAAQAWFAGPQGVGKMGRKDSLGTSVAAYTRKFSTALAKEKAK